MHKAWGPPDDEADNELPDWMRASTYSNGAPKSKVMLRRKSLEKIAEETLKKPLIPVSISEPKLNGDEV